MEGWVSSVATCPCVGKGFLIIAGCEDEGCFDGGGGWVGCLAA